MKAVRLEFPASGSALRPWLLGHAAGSREMVVALAILAASLVALGVCGWWIWHIHTQLVAAQDALASTRITNGRPQITRGTAEQALTPQQLAAWNQVTRQLNTPWSDLLDALEAATPEDVALVSIEPHASEGRVRLQVEARTLDTLLAYAGSLASAPLFEGTTLIKHETNEQDPSRPLRLSLDVRLKRATAVQESKR